MSVLQYYGREKQIEKNTNDYSKKFFKIVICILGIYFIISCLRPIVLRQISKSKIYGAMTVRGHFI